MDSLRAALGAALGDVHKPSERRVYADLDAASVREASRIMYEDIEARFQIASGVDTPEGIEILYHWALDGADAVVTLRTRVDRDAPEIDSITPVCVAAEWIEREMWELLGIKFRDHPDLRHLLLDDDWPQGQYPLRRDYGRDEGPAS
jgi:NADH:ubiquinone oxidoreductase subunit C